MPAVAHRRWSRAEDDLWLSNCCLKFALFVAATGSLFRSAFLVKSGLSKNSFIATGVGIAVLVDITRLSVYGSTIFTTSIISSDSFWLPVVISTVSALFGVSLATDLVKKMTIGLIRNMVFVLIFISGVLLILGKI